MKKKALLMTVVQIVVAIVITLLGIAIVITMASVLFLAPYWVLSYFGLWEEYGEIGYLMELSIIAGVWFLVWIIRELYQGNLEKLLTSNDEED